MAQCCLDNHWKEKTFKNVHNYEVIKNSKDKNVTKCKRVYFLNFYRTTMKMLLQQIYVGKKFEELRIQCSWNFLI